MLDWRVTVFCPVHEKEVILRIKAPDIQTAEQTALGMNVACPWGPVELKTTSVRVKILKDFVDGIFSFKADTEHEIDIDTANRWEVEKLPFERLPVPPETRLTRQSHTFKVEKILSVQPPWEPPATLVGPERKLGVITSLVEIPGVIEIPPKPPKEALYIMPSQLAERLRGKLEWWKPAEHEKVAEKYWKEWREKITESYRRYDEERSKAKEECERRLADLKAKEKVVAPEEVEKWRRELEEWRREREKELEGQLQKAKERAEAILYSIDVVPAGFIEEIREIEKRLKTRLIL